MTLLNRRKPPWEISRYYGLLILNYYHKRTKWHAVEALQGQLMPIR